MTQMPSALALGPRTGSRRSDRGAVAIGRVHFWHGGSLWIGRGQGRTDWHSHHALQIMVALDGHCRFRSRQDAAGSEFSGAIVRSHRPHQFEADGVTVAQIFVEPETTAGRALLRRCVDDVSALPEAEREAMARVLRAAHRHGAPAEPLIAAARSAITLLAGTQDPGDPVDPRVVRAIERIRARIQGAVPLADPAAAVALSPGRFRHLFVQETGISFRAYVLWLRLNLAVASAMAGGSWTEAAHEAGFADSAHLNRTFRRMFGLAPTSLVAR